MAAKEKNLAQLLIEAFYWVDDEFQKSLRERGLMPVSRAQSMFFSQVSAGKTSPTEIARELGVSKQAVHKTIADLVTAGLVELQPDPNDGRAKKAIPTKEGIEFGLAAKSILQEAEQKLASRIGKKETLQLRKILSMDWDEAD